MVSLSIFAVFYGLDWLATVPPTVKLATESFGEREGPIVFGWIAFGHQVGAATAAFGAGVLRDIQGNYLVAFVIAGLPGHRRGLRGPGDPPSRAMAPPPARHRLMSFPVAASSR